MQASDKKKNLQEEIGEIKEGEIDNVSLTPIPEKDADEAMELLAYDESESEYDKEADRKLLLKIDLFLLPVMCTLYCFQFMDKLSNSYASILGLRTDLKMKGDMYAWTGSAFYLGYLFFEYPAVRILQKFPVAKAVGVFVILWGVILCLHSVPRYAGFVALRTILGMMESSITPAFVIITGQYYRREEIFFRTALWFSSNGLGIIIGSGIIAYNVLDHQDSYSIEAWKLVFIITGCLTIALGIVILLHLPDTPAKAWFLTKHEKIMVVNRIKVNQQGFGNKVFKMDQFKEALLDVKTWLYFFFGIFTNIPNGGLTNFASILLSEGFGYSAKQSLLMQMPQGAVEFVGCSLFGYFSGYVQSRMFWAISATVLSTVAIGMLGFSHNPKVELAGYCLYGINPVGLICALASVGSNVTGHTKKTTVNAILLIGYCVGNLIGPQTFLTREAPTYTTAKVTMVVFNILALACLALLLLLFVLENKAKDKKDLSDNEYAKIENIEFADLTDKQNPFFRYTL